MRRRRRRSSPLSLGRCETMSAVNVLRFSGKPNQLGDAASIGHDGAVRDAAPAPPPPQTYATEPARDARLGRRRMSRARLGRNRVRGKQVLARSLGRRRSDNCGAAITRSQSLALTTHWPVASERASERVGGGAALCAARPLAGSLARPLPASGRAAAFARARAHSLARSLARRQNPVSWRALSLGECARTSTLALGDDTEVTLTLTRASCTRH